MTDLYIQFHSRSGDLQNRLNGNESLVTESGAVTAWITVSDADETNDTLTTATTAAGTILIKHTEGTGSQTCFTAGRQLHLIDASSWYQEQPN